MTTDVTSSNRASSIHEISAALRRGAFQTATRLLACAPPLPAELISSAESAMRERRWNHAAWLFDQLADRGGAIGIKRCLSRNLASLEQHRPGLYELMIGLAKNDNVGIGTSASGHPTIVCRTPAGQNIALSPGNMPLQGLGAAMQLLRPVIDAGTCFALCGLGDGYLLHQLAPNSPKLFLDTQLSIFVLEPNPHILLTALMIHDYSGPTGPIEQLRFQWFVGTGWDKQLRETIFADLMLPCPHINIALGLESAAIQKVLNGIVAELTAQDERYRAAVEVYYASLPPQELAAVFGDDPPRKPRALFLTTRFSTVLQFSTHDAADGFRLAGWETSTLIEPTAHHRMMTIASRQRLAEFKPDLVFQIDHLRSEHSGMFPQGLPFVCWIQDHMEQLMTPKAGAKVGPHDFVLTDAGPVYVHNYKYPQRQLIAMSKLTAPPALLPRPKERGEDLVYVSNNTRSPQALLDLLMHEAREDQTARSLLTECWQRLIALYGAGESLPNYTDVCQFLRDLIAEMGLSITEARFADFARVVNHPVCDALYRQQALRWAATAADDLGLKLALYGKGWEAHPELSRFARGPVAHGCEQQALTRRAAINFQIAPYLCLHQRLLDGICTGGFFLVRRHMSDSTPQAMLDLLETHCGPRVAGLNEARACVPPPVRERFERLVKECRRCLCFSGTEDPIQAVRAFQEAQLLQVSSGVLPHLDDISFSDAPSLKRLIIRYVHDAELREQIVAAQRQSIVGRFTYASAMRRVARRMGGLLPARSSNAFVATPIDLQTGRAA